MEIKQDDYVINFNKKNRTVTCSGIFRLTGDEYTAITELLNVVSDAKLDNLKIDLTELQFLNSSGINTLCKFIMRLRKNQITQVTVVGSNKFAWQNKSLTNLKKLLPSLELELQQHGTI